MKEVLGATGLGIASGLALICAFIYDPGYQPVSAAQMIKAQGGDYWYPADQYEEYLQEKAAYEDAQDWETEAFLKSVRAAGQGGEAGQTSAAPAYRTAEAWVPIIDRDSDDAYILAKMAMAEAEGEDTVGKALVMRVILNRVRSDSFPDTIEEVITEPWAFTPISDGRYDRVEPDADCWAAFDMIAAGWDESEGALYFEMTPTRPTWHSENLQELFAHGCHTFYTEYGEEAGA